MTHQLRGRVSLYNLHQYIHLALAAPERVVDLPIVLEQISDLGTCASEVRVGPT